MLGWIAVGVGLTVIVNVFCGPGHVVPALVYCGVTVTVATTGEVPELAAVKALIVPVPEAANPMEGVLFAQVYEVAVPEKEIAVV